MCKCYHIDHPGADPDCEAHGILAVQEQEEQDAIIAKLQARIVELESELSQFKDKKQEQSPKRIYPKFNTSAEESRLTFILQRDGLEAARITAKNLKKTYLEASLKSRQKFKTRHSTYRYSYLESAYSIRHLLRTNFL
jgi:hypothetical protein